MRPSTKLQPGELRSTIWRDQAGIGLAKNGSSHIERCFRWAHEADPRALLFYTDAEAEAVNPKSDAIYAMVRDFRRRGAPIDGVGLQMHIATCTPMFASISENIKRRSACRCTSRRLDAALPVDALGGARREDLRRWRISGVKLLPLAWLTPGARLSRPGERPTNIPGLDRTPERLRALLFDRNDRAKPA
jgi:glycosyl hydrolase family 10